MYRDSDAGYIYLDWEWTGFGGNPAVDLATWMSTTAPACQTNWEHYVELYWNSLTANGVSSDDYPLTKMKADFVSHGTAQIVARYLGLGEGGYSLQLMQAIDAYVTAVGATPDQMVMPIYGYFDSEGFIM